MAKSNHQKLKLLYIAKFLTELTDENHGLSVQELISLLNEYEISADRKTIYSDLDELRIFGFDIISESKGRNVYHSLASREFELPELKLLVDSVQSSKFITENKSRELIKKLEALVSKHDAKQLHRQVILSDRVKNMNESIYYSVDKLHTAINDDVQITFQYYQWNVNKEMELRHGGALYQISPWALVWDDENYYMIGYDAESNILKHYRVDKMLHIEITNCKRQGKQVFNNLNLPKYSKSLFGMYGGDEVSVTLLCENNMAGAIIDRFGKDIPIIAVDNNHFQAVVHVCASKQFLGWIIALGSGVKIISPESIVHSIKQEAKRLSEQYLL